MKHIHLLTVVLTVLLQIPALAFGQPASAAEEARLQQQFPGYRNVDADYRHTGEAALEHWQD